MQLLIHRFLYYVRSEPLIDDFTYDMWERDLRLLVEENVELAARLPYADDCPTTCVGSSNLSDYPRELQYLADSLLDWTKKYPNGHTLPDLLNAEEPEVVSPFGDISESNRTATSAQPGLFA